MIKGIIAISLGVCLSGTIVAGNKPQELPQTFLSDATIKPRLSYHDNLMFLDARKTRRRRAEHVIGVGAHASVLKLLEGNPTLFGFGINGMFSPHGGKNAFFTDLSYYLPSTKTSTDYATAYSSLTYPSQVDINVQTKISGIGFRVGFRRYLIHETSEEGFKMYFQACAGLQLFKGQSTATGYDESQYSVNFDPSSTASGFTLGGGYGLEYSLESKINIFVEGDLNLPANTVNGQAVEVEIPISVQAIFGVRYHF